jgi:hypothetical protein
MDLKQDRKRDQEKVRSASHARTEALKSSDRLLRLNEHGYFLIQIPIIEIKSF